MVLGSLASYLLGSLDKRVFAGNEPLRRRRPLRGFDQVQLRPTGLVRNKANGGDYGVDVVSLQLLCHRSNIVVLNLYIANLARIVFLHLAKMSMRSTTRIPNIPSGTE